MSNDIKIFVNKEFTHRRTKKPARFYKKIIYFYKTYPTTVLMIINKLHILGYWKDYIHMLKYTKDIEHDISIHILDILKTQLLKDIEHYKQGEPFSTLAKWLPRKTFMIGETNFVEYFGKDLFDCTFTYISIIKNLSSKMDVAEIKICDSRIDDVDVVKMPELSYKKNIKKLINNPITLEKVIERLNGIYENMDYWEFVEKICFKKYHETEKRIINVIFNKRIDEFRKKLNFLNFDDIFWVDLSVQAFNDRKYIVAIGMLLLNNNKIIVNCKSPFELKLSGSIFDDIQTIKNNSYPCDKVYTEYYKNYDNNITSISPKMPDMISNKYKAFVINNSFNLKLKGNLIEWNPSLRNRVPKIRQDALNEIVKTYPKSYNKCYIIVSFILLIPMLLFLYQLYIYLVHKQQYYY